jgi:hypothetical protein
MRWTTLSSVAVVGVLAYLPYAVYSGTTDTLVNLFILLNMNLDLFVQYGLMVIDDGALEQLVDLIASAILSIIFFLLFKVCERILVERLTAKKFGASVNVPRDAPVRKGA